MLVQPRLFLVHSEGLQGAGKSTLLNALLDESKLIPTSGMRACTASLIEIRHGLAGRGWSYATEVHWPLAPRHAAEPAFAGGRIAAACGGACRGNEEGTG